MRLGFSLVELSIVLVILGLLTGGILAGKSLIRASELRSVTTEISKYKTSFATFRDKYFQNPGDMTNATKFWGEADYNDGTGSDCRSAQTLDQRTCNGNGDGLIGPHSDWEYARLWQHLSNAGIIEGNYIGTGTPYVTACNVANPGCVFPGSKLGSSNLWVLQTVGVNYVYSYFTGRNALILTNSVGNVSLGGNLIPEEAWNIDSEMDDGRPGLGSIMASRTGMCDTSPMNDGSETARLSANYRLNNSGMYCVLHYMDPL